MITLPLLREQTRQRADMQNSGFVEDSELDTYINNSYLELYDIVVSRFEDYYTKSIDFTISSGNKETLPVDFYKVRGVDYSYGGTYYEIHKWNFNDRNILDRPSNILSTRFLDYRKYRIVGNQIHIIPENAATGDYRFWYVPLATRMVTGNLATVTIGDILFTSALGLYADGNGITIQITGGGSSGLVLIGVVDQAISIQIEDGVTTAQQVFNALNSIPAVTDLVTVLLVGNPLLTQSVTPATNLSGGIVQIDGETFNGWEEYVVIDSAIKCLQKEESDVSMLMAQKQALIKRIENMAANRDAGEPDSVTDVYRQYDTFNWGEF